MNEWMPTATALQERGAWHCPGSQLRYLMPEVHVPRRGYFHTEGEEGLSCGRLVGSSGLETSCDAPPSKAKPQQLLTPSPCNPNDRSGNGIGTWGTTSDIPEHRHTKSIKQHPSPATGPPVPRHRAPGAAAFLLCASFLVCTWSWPEFVSFCFGNFSRSLSPS